MNPGDRGTLWWRALAWLALAVVFTATHWPNLQFDMPIVGGDKVLHASAFLLLTVIWWPTGYVRSMRVFLPAAVAWSLLDESLQALPALRRDAGIPDAVANVCGVFMGCIVVWTLTPIERLPGSSVRKLAWAMMIDRPQAWMACGASAALGALAGGTMLTIAQGLLHQPIKPAHSAIIGATLGMGVAVYATIAAMMRTLQGRIEAARCCTACGEPTAGGAVCSACGASLHPATWLPSPDRSIGGVPDRHWLRVGLLPVITAGLTLVAMLAISVTVQMQRIAWLRPYFGPAEDQGMRLVIDALAISIAVAAGIARSRLHVRRVLQAEGVSCWSCGHDTSKTEAPGGLGRCTECGDWFRRGL